MISGSGDIGGGSETEGEGLGVGGVWKVSGVGSEGRQGAPQTRVGLPDPCHCLDGTRQGLKRAPSRINSKLLMSRNE